jgi:transposase
MQTQQATDQELHFNIGFFNGIGQKQWDGPLLTYGIKVPDWKRDRPVNGEKRSTMKLMRVGVDLAKSVFQVHGVDRHERVVWRRKLTRANWLKVFFDTVEPGCEVGMEACGGAHHWARVLQARGYSVKLIAPQFVKPYVKSNKNDANDAEAICEAMSRPSMRFVTAKTIAQQDVQAVHRVRAELGKQRKAKSNQIRGLVSEYGLVAPKELVHLRAAIPAWLEDAENGLTGRFRRLLNALWHDLRALDQRMIELDREIALMASADPVAKRLQQLRGVGPLIATALVAMVGDMKQFANGRQLAAALGLTPRQNSSGGKERLLGISKRGDAYLRTLLIHGARSALRTAKNKDDRLSQWISRIAERRHQNVAAVALANKTARIAWAMMKNGTVYEPNRATA